MLLNLIDLGYRLLFDFQIWCSIFVVGLLLSKHLIPKGGLGLEYEHGVS